VAVTSDPIRLTRRALLRGGGVMGVALLLPVRSVGAAPVAVAVSDGGPVFLEPEELETLRAVVDRFIPGPPDDPDPGALDAGCAEAIDALLGAFAVDPPRIYAGAPFSDRGGHPVNHFAEFLPLDPYEATAWRLRIEGSQGRAALELNGPVVDYQQIYRDGLAALDEATPGDARFVDAPPPTRDLILRADEPAISELVDVAFVHTLELMYAAPEYGGNRDLAGWEYTGYMGDVQPRGWTREEVENPDEQGPVDTLPGPPDGVSSAQLAAMTGLVSTEIFHHVLARSGGRLSGLEEHAARVARYRDGR
jgi:hypothetical protein